MRGLRSRRGTEYLRTQPSASATWVITQRRNSRLCSTPRQLRSGRRRMTEKRLVLADSLSDEGLAILHASAGLIVDDFSAMSRDELLAGLSGSAGLIVRSATMADAELLEHADSLEVIGRAGVGLDNIDLEAATRRGIAILNAPGGNSVSTAEHTFALLLSVARGIPGAAASMREG
ncbi:MAG: hypothetical protein E4H28_03445, partial [Gemmatimonadales bacterium]